MFSVRYGLFFFFFFFQAEDGIRDKLVTGVQTCALPISAGVDRAAGVGRLGALERRLLRAAHQRARLESRRAVAYVHPTDGRRSGVPDPEERARDSPRVAPAGRSCAGPHPRLLPRLRAVEDARAVAAARGPRTKPAHDLRRVTTHSEHRHRAARRGWS